MVLKQSNGEIVSIGAKLKPIIPSPPYPNMEEILGSRDGECEGCCPDVAFVDRISGWPILECFYSECFHCKTKYLSSLTLNINAISDDNKVNTTVGCFVVYFDFQNMKWGKIQLA